MLPILTGVMTTFSKGQCVLCDQTGLDFQPGQSFRYSNANCETLGLVVLMVSGQSYEEYVAQHIFLPLETQASSPAGLRYQSDEA